MTELTMNDEDRVGRQRRRGRPVPVSASMPPAMTRALTLVFAVAVGLLLSAPPFQSSTTLIGLFGLAGLAAQRAGHLHDRGWSLPATTTNFIGGALGSAAAAALWSAGGWSAVTTAAALASCFAIAVWAAGRRGVVPRAQRVIRG